MSHAKTSTEAPASGSADGGVYLLDNADAAAEDRMAALSALLDAGSIRRLAALGVSSRWSCLEVGAGGGSVARWLADRVAPDGRVLATDLDLRWFDAGRHSNLECRVHDIRSDPLPQGRST